MLKETASPFFRSFNGIHSFGREITNDDLPKDMTFLSIAFPAGNEGINS